MTTRKSKLLKSAMLPMFAVAGLAAGAGVGMSTPASADCAAHSQTAELPAAKARDGEMVIAACTPSAPCAAKEKPGTGTPCGAQNPCGAHNPCSAKSK